MQTRTELTAVFDCSLERAFKSPMLCDITKVHSGYGMMTPITHCTEDEMWGKVGGSRRTFMAGSFFYKAGQFAMDRVVERRENEYWKIELYDIKPWILAINKFEGEWSTMRTADSKIRIRYVYTLFSDQWILYPLQWLFTKTVWRIYMRHVIEKVRGLAMSEAPYMHD